MRMSCVCVRLHLRASVYRRLNVWTRLDVNGFLRLDKSLFSGCTSYIFRTESVNNFSFLAGLAELAWHNMPDTNTLRLPNHED